ncbi:MAG: hypothetical protein ACTHOR_19355 [Devosia sp.]|jgi:hypothetical protein|nr:hypothetical protein [Devosiaceae bacterium]
MPTLIRLIVALLFLGGLGFAGLFALTIFVDPGQKQITVQIPKRELVLTPVVPKPEAPVVEAAQLPAGQDDPNAQLVNTPE